MDKDKNKSIRSFIAIELEEPVRNLLSKIQSGISAKCGNIRWIVPESLHITLRFLGDITVEQQMRLEQLLSNELRTSTSFTLSLEGLGVFPDYRHPQVLWVGIGAGNTQVKEITRKIERQLVCEGFQPEKRAYIPHATIARIKSIHDKKAFRNEIEKYQETFFAEMKTSMISLMRSTLTPMGAVYLPLKRVPLIEIKKS